jgi:hypothetical protein
MRCPGLPRAYPTKDEIADYLQAYARGFDQEPTRAGSHLDHLVNTHHVVCGNAIDGKDGDWKEAPRPLCRPSS